MSIVGPRPERVELVQMYTEEILFQNKSTEGFSGVRVHEMQGGKR